MSNDALTLEAAVLVEFNRSHKKGKQLYKQRWLSQKRIFQIILFVLRRPARGQNVLMILFRRGN